jgi:S-adenosylmethionine:tRNA ribosyltransferase-isomerase
MDSQPKNGDDSRWFQLPCPVPMNKDDFTFDYDLPKRLIAQQPLENRVDARLMLVDRRADRIEHHYVRDIPQLLAAGDRLVLNNTKVVPAALQGLRTSTGGNWQGLFLEVTPHGQWKIICKTRGHLKVGEQISLLDRRMRPAVKLWLIERLDDGQWLAQPDPQSTCSDLLAQVGRIPLPHYIRGGRMVDSDVVNYQTIYAREPGAVAAPTAGLHFTKHLLEAIESRGVAFTAVTLHVGLGTFRPIQSESLEDHQMHEERGELTEAAAKEINATREAGGRIVAVGTTVVRVLETAFAQAGEVLLEGDTTSRKLAAWSGKTDLFIRPPYQFGAIDALMTNFHFPGTTLLVLVQTYGGRDLIRRAYEEAIREEYRFFSYGDAMLIL